MGFDASLPTGASVETAAQAPVGSTNTGVQSVTGAAAGVVDNTDPQNPIIELQFGEDTTISKANAAAIQKTILELIAEYDSNVNGAETSNWLIKTLLAGAQISAAKIGTIGGNFGVWIPSGGVLGLTTDGSNFTGLFFNASGGNHIRYFVHGTQLCQWFETGVLQFSLATQLKCLSNLATQSPAIAIEGRLLEQANQTQPQISGTTLILGNPQTGGGNHFIDPGGNFQSILLANWSAGSRFRLELVTGRTVTHNGAPGAGAAKILVKGGVNYVSTADVAAQGYSLLEFVLDSTATFWTATPQ